MYVTATSPYILLLILLVRALTLPGAWEGIKFYLWPDWIRLTDPQVTAHLFLQLTRRYHALAHATLCTLRHILHFGENAFVTLAFFSGVD